MTNSKPITIRPRTPSDIPPLTGILTTVFNLTHYPVDGPSSFPARFSSPNALHSIVALHGSTLAGHAELQDASTLNPVVANAIAPIESYAALVSLFVDPSMQGKGIGVRLVEEAMAWGRANGKRLVLVVLDKDVAAIGMYEKMGWGRLKGIEYCYETKEGEKYRAFAYLAPE